MHPLNSFSLKIMKNFRISLTVIFTVILSAAFSQDINQAGEMFNKGISAQQAEDYPGAIAAYQQALSICSQLGDAGADLGLKSEKQLALSHFSMGKKLFGEKKYDEALTQFGHASEYAQKIADDKTFDASHTYMAGINFALGNNLLKNENYDGAVEKYTLALQIKPDYYKAYYGLGLVYKKQENLPLMKENLDKAISMAGTDQKTIDNSKDAAATAFRNEGAKALQNSNYQAAADQLSTSIEYNQADPKTSYYLSVAYNGLKRWDDALTATVKALETETGDKSDIYFEVGKANEGKGDAAAACKAYKSVTTGVNVKAAVYQIEQVLKCK